MVYVYTLAGDSLSEKTSFSVSGEISAMAYSPDGESLAVTSDRTVMVYDSASYQVGGHYLERVQYGTRNHQLR